MKAMDAFTIDLNQRREDVSLILGRELTSDEDNAVFINHLRQRLGLSPAYSTFRIHKRKLTTFKKESK